MPRRSSLLRAAAHCALMVLLLTAGCEPTVPGQGEQVARTPRAPAPTRQTSASLTAARTHTPVALPGATALMIEEPSATSSPRATAVRGSAVPPDAGLATLDTLATLALPKRDLVALGLQYGRTRSPERVVRRMPLPDMVGSQTPFRVWDWNTDRFYTTTATLRLALDHVLMYVEDGLAYDQPDLERSARVFDERIYPRTRELFGSEWTPGIDGDPRITILNARIVGAGGYFSISDEVPRSVLPFSNEREMFYMNVASYPLGSDAYSAVLAHELQHMIAWPHAQLSETWLNEGLSELAVQLNGYQPTADAATFLRAPDVQLTAWGDEPNLSTAHYAATYLFMAYVHERYGTLLDLQQLVREGAGRRLDRFAAQIRKHFPDVTSFDALFADWAVANLIGEAAFDDGRWSYRVLSRTVEPAPLPATPVVSDVAQYGADYWLLSGSGSARTLEFDGSDMVGLVAAPSQGGASWWSNRGDDATSTLTRECDLRGVTSATLRFRLWYDLQPGYDYGFVSASTDAGRTWRTLRGRHTTTDDPAGANYGHGYTGVSGQGEPRWLDEQVDLTPFAGRKVQIRFSTVTDDSVHHAGMLVDAIRIPEVNSADDAEQPGDWQTAGWVRTDNRLPQHWQLRLVRSPGSAKPRVEPIALDQRGRGTIRLDARDDAVLVVMATTPHTTQRATYRIAPVR